METMFSILVGLGLAAACGFRIFVPFLVMSAAATTGHLPLAEGFEWIGTRPALIAFGVATLLEVLAFYVPWLDNALDVLAGPATIVAGIVATASVVTDVPPFVRWSVAVVAGGGIAGGFQGGGLLLRSVSTATTGGLGNFVVATFELLGSLLTSVLAIGWPVLVLPILALFVFVSVRRIRGRRESTAIP
jgi:hypothetical protein